MVRQAHHELGLSRENRTLRMVGLCNQALLRATDEMGLIETICTTTVKKGGYRMAWVGFAEVQDGAKVVRPVAHAGIEKGYLDKLNLTWDNTERGRGPTGTAIRTGKPSFIGNVQKDPRVKIWRKDAIEQGYASLVSLPLSDKGKVFGALILYSSEPDDFTEAEISLLNQLAGDLAFGIKALRAAAEHARLEAEMRRSEAKFRSLIEHSYDLITVMDRDTNRVYESPSVERILGFKPGERTDWKYEANPPEDQAKAREMIKKALASPGVPIEGHLKVMRKDGSAMEGDLVMTNLLDDPAVKGIVINSRDVTEKMKALNAVKESETQLSLILNNVSDVIFSVAVDGEDYRFAWVNRRFTDVTGVPKDKIVGVPVAQVIPPPAHALVFGKYKEAIETRKPVFWEELSDYPAGKRYGQVTIVPVFDGNGQCRHLIGLVHDMTESRNNAERMVESERKYRELVENANSIILRWRRDGKLTFLNEFGQKFFGYTAQEIVGRNVMGTIVPATESSGRDLSRLMDQILADPASFEQNTNENMRRNGERVWIAWTNKIVKDGKGQIAEILSIGTDITARKKAEDEVRELNAGLELRVRERTAELAVARDRAEAADRLKSAFLATMSHELRTPLNSIIGFTGILLQKLAGPLNDEQGKQLGMVQESARHLLSLINDVLDISKIEAGQLEVHREPFDLKESLLKAAGILRPLAEKKGLALKLEIGPEVGEVVGDPRRVEQVVLNLLNNAVKFTAQGSVTLGAAVEEGRIKVWVVDTGIGIKKEDFDKLFRSFQQIDTGLTRQHEGTGLGLAICKRLAELMGGDVLVESEWGKGSRFTLVLPLEKGITTP